MLKPCSKMFLVIILFFFCTSILGAGKKAGSDSNGRSVTNNLFVSTELPAIKVLIDDSFKYVGKDAFILKEIVEVERFHFVEAAGNKVKRMFVIQCEDALEGVDFTYRYSYKNPVLLGGERYRHNTWFYNNADNIKQNPNAEMDHTLRLLQKQGLELEDELMMSRFVRDYGLARKNEIILFYFENISSTGHSLAGFEDGSLTEAEVAAYEKGLTERSYQAFEVVSESETKN